MTGEILIEKSLDSSTSRRILVNDEEAQDT